MYKNRAASGKNNISGTNIARIRKALHPKVSQRLLSVKMQLEGIELDKNAIQRIDSIAVHRIYKYRSAAIYCGQAEKEVS